MRGNRLVIGLALVVGVVACSASAEDRARTLCATICNCDAPPTRSAQEQCVDQCTADVVTQIDLVSDECEACITSHFDRCATVQIDCEPICQLDQQPPPVGLDDGGVGPNPPPVIVDAQTTDAF